MTSHTLNINDQGCWIGDTLINETIFQEEMSDYAIRDKQTMEDDLFMWIAESKSDGEKLAMKSDLRDLQNYEGEYFLSSISTNDFLFPDDPEFHDECDKILKLNKGLEK